MATSSFWDVVEGRAEQSPIAGLQGFKLQAVDPEAMSIEVGFTARPEFCNPVGHTQGGILAAMLDDTLAPALVAPLGEGQWAPTTDLHVQFLAPAQPGTLTGRGCVTRKGRQVAFMAGELNDSKDRVIATGMATAMIREANPASTGPVR